MQMMKALGRESLLRDLEVVRDALASFQLERQRLDHQPEWDKALALAKQAIAFSHLLGFHATRLMDHEIEEIKRSGLELGSAGLLQRRLAAAQNAGKLTPEQVKHLFACHQAADSNRTGRTAFFFTRAQLKTRGSGLDRLCRSWGGEALYKSYESDPEMGPLLRGLGTARIVVAAVKVADIEERFDIHHRLVNSGAAGAVGTVSITDPPFLNLGEWFAPIPREQLFSGS